MRTWEQKLLLDAFDPAPFTDAVNRVAAAGYSLEYLKDLDGDPEYVGVTSLTTTEEEAGMLHTGLTGVRQGHRGTGLAYALKVKSLLDARAAGFTSVLTWNESNNRPMLAVNARLGFERQPAWIDFNKSL